MLQTSPTQATVRLPAWNRPLETCRRILAGKQGAGKGGPLHRQYGSFGKSKVRRDQSISSWNFVSTKRLQSIIAQKGIWKWERKHMCTACTTLSQPFHQIQSAILFKPLEDFKAKGKIEGPGITLSEWAVNRKKSWVNCNPPAFKFTHPFQK